MAENWLPVFRHWLKSIRELRPPGRFCPTWLGNQATGQSVLYLRPVAGVGVFEARPPAICLMATRSPDDLRTDHPDKRPLLRHRRQRLPRTTAPDWPKSLPRFRRIQGKSPVDRAWAAYGTEYYNDIRDNRRFEEK